MALPLIAGIAGMAGAAAQGNQAAGDRPVWQRILDPIGGIWNNGLKTQEESQKRLNQNAAELNYQYGEKAAENAAKRGYDYQEQWYKSYGSPEAIVEQLKAAGLNPALMYSGAGGGGGGNTVNAGPQGGGAGGQQGGNAAAMAMTQQQGMMNAIQSAMSLAAIKKTQAETKGLELDNEERANGMPAMERDIRIKELNAKNLAAESAEELELFKLGLTNIEDESAKGRNNHRINNSPQIINYKAETAKKEAEAAANRATAGKSEAEKAQIIKTTNEVIELQKKYLSGQISQQAYITGIKAWEYKNRNLFKGIDVAKDIIGAALHGWGISKIGAAGATNSTPEDVLSNARMSPYSTRGRRRNQIINDMYTK